MILSVNGNNENVRFDEEDIMDLFDFAHLVEKYMGYEPYKYYIESLESFFDYIEQMESEINDLQDEIEDLQESLGDEDA